MGKPFKYTKIPRPFCLKRGPEKRPSKNQGPIPNKAYMDFYAWSHITFSRGGRKGRPKTINNRAGIQRPNRSLEKHVRRRLEKFQNVQGGHVNRKKTGFFGLFPYYNNRPSPSVAFFFCSWHGRPFSKHIDWSDLEQLLPSSFLLWGERPTRPSEGKGRGKTCFWAAFPSPPSKVYIYLTTWHFDEFKQGRANAIYKGQGVQLTFKGYGQTRPLLPGIPVVMRPNQTNKP